MFDTMLELKTGITVTLLPPPYLAIQLRVYGEQATIEDPRAMRLLANYLNEAADMLSTKK